MILYTIEPYERIFGEPDRSAPTCMKSTDFGLLEVNKRDGTIRRVISTDPAVYLNGKYSPGKIFTESK